MLALILAIQTELRTAITYIKARDVFITEDVNLIRAAGDYPAIAIKDGPVQFSELSGGVTHRDMVVHLVAIVKLQKQEAAIIGDPSTSEPGVLKIIADIRAALYRNLLGLSGVISAIPQSETESGIYFDNQGGWQKKQISINYEWEE